MEKHPLAAVLHEMADLYETAAALPPIVERDGAKGRTTPGPRVPPGLTEAIDADEHRQILGDVDAWAAWAVHVLIDAHPRIGTVPDLAPGRLRLTARWVVELLDVLDEHERLDLGDSVRLHRRRLRGLTRRGTHVVQTGSACLTADCPGEYVATIAGPQASSDLACSVCHGRVGHEQWTRWEAAAPEWVTVEYAAWLLGTTKNGVYIRASRSGWRKQGRGKQVRYWRADVRAARGAVSQTVAG